MPMGPREWSPRPASQAEVWENAVRQAFVDVYGAPKDLGVVERTIRSSDLPEGRKLGWTKADPDVVLVMTESAWVQEPYSSKQDHDNWDRVIELLKSRGWTSAGWDSINAAVQVVFLYKGR
jgi:hypothetical protein